MSSQLGQPTGVLKSQSVLEHSNGVGGGIVNRRNLWYFCKKILLTSAFVLEFTGQRASIGLVSTLLKVEKVRYLLQT